MSNTVPVVLYVNLERILVGEATLDDNGQLETITVDEAQPQGFSEVPAEFTLVPIASLPENANLMNPPPVEHTTPDPTE